MAECGVSFSEERRLELHHKLCHILGSDEVYFQPPSKVRMQYPAIVYKLSDLQDVRADNRLYKVTACYEAVLMHKDPSNRTYIDLINMPMTKFVRYFAKDNLNHYVYRIYY